MLQAYTLMPDLEMFAQRLMCIFGDVAVILASTFSKISVPKGLRLRRMLKNSREFASLNKAMTGATVSLWR